MINDLSCKGSGFRRSGKVFASRENFASESRNAAFGIRNPTKFENLESKFKQRLESSTWNPESTAWNPESKTVLDSLAKGELCGTFKVL